MLSNSTFSINTLTNETFQHQEQFQNNTEKMRFQNYQQQQQVCYSVQNMVPQYGEQIKIDLEEKELWTRFYHLTNEMILTKAGRRTFPLIRIKMSGMDESALYTVQIEFRPSDNLKYRFVNGEWKSSPKNDNFKSSQQSILYEHSDSPNFGHHWSKDSVAFAKLKLTNNENTKNLDAVFLKSLNKYDPVIHVYKHDKKNVDDKVLVFSKFFKETQFIAVTAYQNEQITNLKIKHNPFAKAFLNNKPMITIENDKVIEVEKKIENIEPVSVKKNFSVQHALLAPKQEPVEQKVTNNQWNYYQPQNFQYAYQNQFSYPNVYDQYYNTNFYQAYNPYNQYAQQFNNFHLNHNQYYQNQENLVQNYYPFQYDYNHLLDTSNQQVSPSDRTKQSSPIYESTYKLNDSGKRSIESVNEQRPAKRQAVSQNDLPVSPVYRMPKLEFAEQSDDSLNSTDNFYSHLSNQTNQSSSSFTLSSTNGSL
ncbi:unnamed protein product [Brachionus calyciflorus]|uniref:T-box domain-containing protein n=1 Tax=Brachionus calyciflorus TaxID=104777 RepID=A0A813M3T9_9BILA|nr:unnamed protein product [Brachionus calyciflorus]